MRTVRVAVVGAGPAGIYAAAGLVAAGPGHGVRVLVDVFDRLPTPYGLVRYGTAPDHQRIKEVVVALRAALAAPEIRFFGNVEYGGDLKLAELRQCYHAVVVATGAATDRPLTIPGADLPGSHGGADFVAWYNGHPDVPRDWPLTARSVAVLGAGNVALDIARMLAKPAAEQLATEIPDNVARGLAGNAARDIHLFARRGPADAKFTPLELRELAESPSVDVSVDPVGAEVSAAEEAAIGRSGQRRTVLRTLLDWVGREPTGAARRIHLHFRAAPVSLLGDERVETLRTERTETGPDGTITFTGEHRDWPVQAVYRAIGYRSTPLPDVPFDDAEAVVPGTAGRVVDLDHQVVPGLYATGWIRRGPVGLIGHTKSDAAETVGSLLADLAALPDPDSPGPEAIVELLRAKKIDFTTLAEWDRLDAYEISLGEASGRRRTKVVSRIAMINGGRDT
ncbi:FAD-dependent oxidoreductase [Microlunatus parietis]